MYRRIDKNIEIYKVLPNQLTSSKLLCRLSEKIYKNDLCNQVNPFLFWIFVTQHFKLQIVESNDSLSTSWISSWIDLIYDICFWTFFYFDIQIWFL
jgi:hypothetical protein